MCPSAHLYSATYISEYPALELDGESPMSTRLEENEGSLQLKVLLALMECPSFGTDLMKKIGISSPGTIYPVLKLLKRKGLIEVKTIIRKKKYYVLSEKGKQQIQNILLHMGRKYFSACLDPDWFPWIKIFDETISLTPNLRILCNMNYEPVRQWLGKMDVTYKQFLEEPEQSYNFAIIQIVATMILYDLRKEELSRYFSKIVESLEPESTLVMIEIEKVENVFMKMFFRKVLGFTKVPGITETELKELIESYGLEVTSIKKEMGTLICITRKPKIVS